MFDQLSERLGKTIKKIRGQARLTEDNIQDTLRQIRIALLEADVALPVVRELTSQIKEKAIGVEVQKSLTPGQVLIKIVNDEMAKVMGQVNESLNLATQPPAIILMTGLQGAGKTTTTGKLARYLKAQNKKVLVCSADIYRPAAMQQLQKVAEQVGVDYFQADDISQAQIIGKQAVAQAKKQFYDVLIMDTAGRLHVDTEMMNEVVELQALLNPVETLFVVDGMSGQDAANSAKAFNEALPLTGVILTKMDGDARGGAALSVRHITGKPIKFLGMGEASDALEPFHPDRIASRILGMGDVVSLVEQVSAKVDHEHAQKLVKKLKKGKSFDLDDFKNQLEQMEKMGGIGSMLDKLPGVSSQNAAMIQSKGNTEFKRTLAIINSMTLTEKRQPEVIKGSRKRRIATGSGTQVQDINRMLKQFMQMQKMMKKMGNKGQLRRMMGAMKGGGNPFGGGGGGMPF